MSRCNSLADAISEALAEEYKNIDISVSEVTDGVSQKALEELKQSSPRGARKSYARGWRKLKADFYTQKRYSNLLYGGKHVVRLHNKTDYPLTHLLEFGHATRSGGHTKAIPHIRPIEEKYKNMYETELTTVLRHRDYDVGKSVKKIKYK